MEDRPDRVIRHLCHVETMCLRDIHSSTIFPLKYDVGFGLVEANSEAFELAFDNPFVCHRLLAIEHDKNTGAGTRHTDDLLTTTLTILSSFDNTGQIKQLHLRPSIVIHTRYTC